jgi:hypothetical protein
MTSMGPAATRGASLALALAIVLPAGVSCSSFGSSGETSSGTPAPDGGGRGEGGAAPPPSEDCLDGVDNDGNGRTDCDEPTCTPYVHCLPPPAAYPGWTGYVTLVPADTPCPADLPVAEDVWSPDDGAATCPTCQCTPQVTCGTSMNPVAALSGCMTTYPFSAPVTTTCTPISDNHQYFEAGSISTNATCTSSTVGSTTLPPDKYHAARVCSGARFGGGCVAGEVCATLQPTGLCVSRPIQGAPMPCPDAFPISHISAPKAADPGTAFADHRGCVACTCDAKPAGASCGAALQLYSDNGCSTLKGTVTAGCTNVDCSGQCKGAKLTTSPTPGTCGAHGGSPSGAVDLTGAGTQYCCDR